MEVGTVERQQAALNLIQLSGQGTAGIDTLVDTLLVSTSHQLWPPGFSLLTHIQTNADPSVISLMARANLQHLGDAAKLNQTDEQGLRGMLAQLEAMQAQVKELLMCRGELPSPATPNTANDLPENPSRAVTGRNAFDALVANLPGDDRLDVTAARAAESKELPSPPATDLPDEKAQLDGAQDTIAVATSSPADIKGEVEEDDMDME